MFTGVFFSFQLWVHSTHTSLAYMCFSSPLAGFFFARVFERLSMKKSLVRARIFISLDWFLRRRNIECKYNECTTHIPRTLRTSAFNLSDFHLHKIATGCVTESDWFCKPLQHPLIDISWMFVQHKICLINLLITTQTKNIKRRSAKIDFTRYVKGLKQQGVLLPPPSLLDGMLVHRRVTPSSMSPVPVYYTWVERGNVE